jgi:hypothetical protein
MVKSALVLALVGMITVANAVSLMTESYATSSVEYTPIIAPTARFCPAFTPLEIRHVPFDGVCVRNLPTCNDTDVKAFDGNIWT